MDVDSESDTDPLSDIPMTSDEESLADYESDTTSDTSYSSQDESQDMVQEDLPATQNTASNTEDSNSEGTHPPLRHRIILHSTSDESSTGTDHEEDEADVAEETDASAAAPLEPIPSVSTTEEKPSLTSAKLNESMGNDDDSMSCPICFENWTTSGTHRLVSLKCGHLFGLACIEKWIKQPKAKCPQCNHLARKTDIRKIYARSLKVLDTSERDAAVKKFEEEQEKCRRAEVEAASVRLKYQMASQECERYKRELLEHKNTIELLRQSKLKMGGGNYIQEAGCVPSYSMKGSSTSSFVLDRTLDLCKEGGCRLLAASNLLPILVASQPGNNSLFSAFGFRKISTMDFRQMEFVPVHKKALKDLAFHSHDSLLLSVAQDKTVKITNVYSNSVVQSYPLEVDAWSCTWSKDNSNTFFAGLRTGSVLQFDTRMTSRHVNELPSTGKGHPVVGLQYLQKNPAATIGMSGPVSLQLSACTFYEQRNSGKDYRIHPMPLEGNFTSLCLEPTTEHMLVSCRPSTHQPKVTHLLCELTYKNVSPDPSAVDNVCSCNIVQSIEGGPFQTQLTRSRLFMNPANHSSVIACAGDENSKAVMIWDASINKCLSQLPADSTVMDLCSFRLDSTFCLGTLTEKQLRLYKWQDR